jgi:excisionase family DNA binding protein
MTVVDRPDPDALLTPGEVASIFRVTPKTVTRWAEAGKLPALRTLGGHRRFPASAVRDLVQARLEELGLSHALIE